MAVWGLVDNGLFQIDFWRFQMTIEEVIELLRQEYEKAKQKPWVIYPMAYALHQTLMQVDINSRKTIKH